MHIEFIDYTQLVQRHRLKFILNKKDTLIKKEMI